MSKKADHPIYRIIHHDEAKHHAEIKLKKMKLKKGTKKYNEYFNKFFLEYINDAQESLYPSGNLEPKQNPTRSSKSLMERLKERHPLYSKLDDKQMRKLTTSKAWKFEQTIREQKMFWQREFDKHIKRGAAQPSDLEHKNMIKIENKLLRHIKKSGNIKNPESYVARILKEPTESFEKRFREKEKSIIKSLFDDAI
jgi:hypothetical protein